ncbi:hypothetical protein [Granulicella sp. S190]|uniref:hypothetical protein n=1 Tax=Granulicella sp. S190 TaxID=1747226 RepID=UPI00131CB7B1|nr:hypothetical protein [Granulicella sp. S190]
MSENLISITISCAILLMMFVFVPCLELTARGCRKINRSMRPLEKHKDNSKTKSVDVMPESLDPVNKQANSRSSNAA